MFITPDFTVSQDEEGPWAPGRGFVILRVRAPHVRAQQVELAVDGRQVKFHARPFFLSLTLPGEVVEDERASASYDVDEGRFTVVLPKADPAEHFPDLDLLTKLLAPSRRAPPAGPGPGTAPTPLVQVLGSGGSTLDVLRSEEFADFDWQLPQEIDPEEVNPTGTASYGFNDQYSGVLAHFREAGNEVMELDDPEHSTPASRRSERTRAEDRKFSGDYYIGEILNEQEPLDHLSYVCPWVEDEERSSDVDACAGQVADLSVTAGENVPPEVAAGKVAPAPKSWALNETEREEMRKLANKEFLINDPRSVYLGLVDILYCYCYDHRVTEGEGNVESAWTVCKLSPLMSSLDSPSNLHDLLVALYRRSLSYPLYRSWRLCEAVRRDLRSLLRSGKRGCLKALLEVKRHLDHHDVYHVYSHILLNDYCVWVMGASEKALRSLAREIKRDDVTKAEIGWDLPRLDAIAQAELSSLGEARAPNVDESSGADDDRENEAEEEVLVDTGKHVDERRPREGPSDASAGAGDTGSVPMDLGPATAPRGPLIVEIS